MKKATVCGCLILAVILARGYPPPTAEKGGFCLSIREMGQGPKPKRPDWNPKNIGVRELDADVEQTFTFVLSNGTNKAVSGRFGVKLNEDWSVIGGMGVERLTVAAGEVKTLTRQVMAKQTVLPALYPLHAKFVSDDGAFDLHPIAVFRAKTDNRAFVRRPRIREKLREGAWRLDCGFGMIVQMHVKGRSWVVANPEKSDPVSNGNFRKTPVGGFTSGVSGRCGFSVHPPYATGPGEVTGDFPMELPDSLPVVFRFYNALSDTGKGRNPGDGVCVRVLVKADGESTFTELYRREIDVSGAWISGSADLSAYAGKKIVLRLAGDPGEKNNTTCDSHAWGDPVIEVGTVPPPATEVDWRERETLAEVKAKRALDEGARPGEGVYLLVDRGVSYGAGVAFGKAGLLDAAFAFTDGHRVLCMRGFEVDLDGERLTCLRGMPEVEFSLKSEKGALTVGWTTRHADKEPDGSPRFTRIAPGPLSLAARRIYGGTGCVWENMKGRFVLTGDGFALSTRHVGMDFDNGLSLVQAVSLPADMFEVDTSNRLARLVAHNDVSFSFVPSNKGAFDAAVRFAAVSGYRASPGCAAMRNRICIDDWSGGWGDASGYLKEADALRQAKRYGLDDVLYLQHNWQRWGYDTKLPEVYPPKGRMEDFQEMVRAAKESGYLFGIHDNYVDYYPDAKGFSYRLFCYNEDGTPLEAWYNPGPRSLSYRWLPQAIHSCLKRNMALQKEGFAPTALFLDVFTATGAKDVIDCEGRFHPQSENLKEWCRAWTECRKAYGVPDAVMVSEAASDSQIGFVDAGEADHFNPKYLSWKNNFADGERVPWHDAVTHGKMLLFGGGLGFRYSRTRPGDNASGDNDLHGWGTDDYLSTTVIGGRVPMGPSFCRLTAKTYWLLHDVCGALGSASFEGLDFKDGNIHRQHSRFSNGGEVWVNRGTNSVWRLSNGRELPTYGFYARLANGVEADVSMRNGIRTGCAKGKETWFVDARPMSDDGRVKSLASRVVSARVSGRKVELKTSWDIYRPIRQQLSGFTHGVPQIGRGVAIHGHGVRLTPDMLATPGHYEQTLSMSVPDSVPEGKYFIRYGLCESKSGERLPIRGVCDQDSRVRGGMVVVRRSPQNTREIIWEPSGSTDRDRVLDLNVDGVMADFSGIRTDGAFRFHIADWRIVPMPGSGPFRAEIDLSRFGARGRLVTAIVPEEPLLGSDRPSFRQDGDIVMLECDGLAFAYAMKFGKEEGR